MAAITTVKQLSVFQRRSKCFKPPSAATTKAGRKSERRRGSIACVSGSPKRALNSITFGPSTVIISPAKSVPLKGLPSSFMASTMGRTIVDITVSVISSVITGAGE